MGKVIRLLCIRIDGTKPVDENLSYILEQFSDLEDIT